MPPFTVLHICMGNICRSPMAERLLSLSAGDVIYTHSAGTGGWHEGEEMNPPAARQVKSRGGSTDGFAARKLKAEHIDSADLVLTATADQYEYVLALRPDAAAKTFVLGQFGRLLKTVNTDSLPADPYDRGLALVARVDELRAGAPPLRQDDLDDPWGRGDQVFSRVADEIQDTVVPLADILNGR
ncbi:arsenate reductase/protein-tyrosine-phosphatase family protein [Catelliglobosispora koreensis]|uniref:arsenate reductase/protein-tyrosine-phosphatase family protein n=1 Tax=Catelliglobosispora koreensis TaxID=129052 RepID=UPI0004780027|nr:phosphotyrosine protein phosphatase [Catelliglobosispora koreensis]